MFKRKIILCLLSAFLPMLAHIAAQTPKHEMRGAWVATVYGIDWPSRQGSTPEIAEHQRRELIAIFDSLQTAGLNAVLLQVRPMADALYHSDKEPWSAYLTGERGVSPAGRWDPLEFAIGEAHARGMELHAWVNPFRFAMSPTLPTTPYDRKAYQKGWIITHRTGGSAGAGAKGKSGKKKGRRKAQPQPKGKAVSIFDPGNEGAVGHVLDVCRDIVRNYDIDGLVFDDYFYPDRFPLPAGENPEKAADLRRHYVNRAVASVYAMIQKEKPYVRFGVAPAGVAGGNGKATAKYNLLPPIVGNDWMYDRIYCDPLAWLSEGTVDYVSPQLYWPSDHSTNPYGPLAQWWEGVAKHFRRHCFASHSLTNVASTPEHWREQGRQIDFDRESAAPGSVLYSVASMSGKKAGGLASYLGMNHYAVPALMPSMEWKHASDPGKVRNLRIDDDGVLSWTGNKARRYVVYAIPYDISAADASDDRGINFLPAYIAGVSYGDSFTLPSYLTADYWYAVAPYDRYGNEWKASVLHP